MFNIVGLRNVCYFNSTLKSNFRVQEAMLIIINNIINIVKAPQARNILVF